MSLEAECRAVLTRIADAPRGVAVGMRQALPEPPASVIRHIMALAGLVDAGYVHEMPRRGRHEPVFRLTVKGADAWRGAAELPPIEPPAKKFFDRLEP